MYLYEIKNLINGKIYIGIHTTNNLYDGYSGSGKFLNLAYAKYGKHNFKKTILAFYTSLDDLVNDEKKIVDVDFVRHPQTYNCDLGGSGGKIWTKELREKMSKTQKLRFFNGDAVWNKGKNHKEDKRIKLLSQKTKMKISSKVSGENNGMYGVDVATKMTESANKIRLKKISKANSGKCRTEEHRKNYSNAASARIWITNVKTGKISHTTNKEDERLNHPDWKRGKGLKE